MNKIFLAGAALAVLAAAPAAAQPGEGRSRLAQPLTRAAVAARVQARFARADSDRDGFVTRDEVRARAEARREQRGQRRDRRFERLDSNRDGTISLEERQAAREAFRERMHERQGD